MRALSLSAAVVLLSTTLQVSAGQSARGSQPAPRTPGTGATKPRTSSPAAPPRREVTVPFRVGETLTYDVAWSTFLVAGSAVSRIVEKRPSYNSWAYYIVAEGRPIPIIARFYSVYYKMDSLLDSFTALSQHTSTYQEEGSKKRTATTTFSRNTRRAQFEVQDDPTLKGEFTVPQNVQDGLATLYTLRTRSFTAGERLSVPVADDGMLYTANFEASGPEPLKVPLGEMEAWHLRITILDAMNQPVGSNIGAWISTDARRLPLKLQADLPVGTFVLALRNAQ